MPAVATTLLGVLAGHWLLSGRAPGAVAAGLAVAGLAATAMGALWGLWFPINKPLWTSSYALFSGGLAALTLAAATGSVEARAFAAGPGPSRGSA